VGWFSRKSLPAPGGNGVTVIDGNWQQLSPWKLNNCAIEGYAGNPVVYSCINIIANACASVKLEVHKKNSKGDVKILSKHALLDLLANPNPTQTGKGFIRELVTHYLYAGEAFPLRSPQSGKEAKELYLLEPRQVEVEAPKDGSGAVLPISYKYGTGANQAVYPVNQVTGASAVKHIKMVNPLSAWRGLSPMMPAARDIDIHNDGRQWNASLLKNGAKPSGFIELAAGTTTDTINKIVEVARRIWQGKTNAGGVAVMTAGSKFTQTSMTPKDMDFKNGLAEASKNIAMVYGVPLPLVTMEAATFSNLDAAKETLWTDTVLPLLDDLIGALSDFLAPAYGDGVYLAYNADSVSALENKRQIKFDRMVAAVKGSIVTPNEAREEIGFDPVDQDGADDLLIPDMMISLDDVDEDLPNTGGEQGGEPDEDDKPAKTPPKKNRLRARRRRESNASVKASDE
jgi:HK97 family phage portal protein